MKTLEEIKDEVAKEYKFTDWENLMCNTGDRVQDRAADEVTHRYALEVVREALKNAIIKQDEVLERFAYRTHGPFAESLRESILDDKNIPEL